MEERERERQERERQERERKRQYIKWLDERKSIAYQFAVPVDNSRPNIINMAMKDLVLRNSPALFGLGIITDNEAALWMSQNIPTLESTQKTRLLIEILNAEINYVNDVIAGTQKDDKKARPSVEKMMEMIEILKKPRPVVASASAAPAAAAPGGSRRRNKKSKNSKKKSRKTKSRRH